MEYWFEFRFFLFVLNKNGAPRDETPSKCMIYFNLWKLCEFCFCFFLDRKSVGICDRAHKQTGKWLFIWIWICWHFEFPRGFRQRNFFLTATGKIQMWISVYFRYWIGVWWHVKKDICLEQRKNFLFVSVVFKKRFLYFKKRKKSVGMKYERKSDNVFVNQTKRDYN